MLQFSAQLGPNATAQRHHRKTAKRRTATRHRKRARKIRSVNACCEQVYSSTRECEWAIIVAGCAMVLCTSPAVAQGGDAGRFGFTFGSHNPYVGPKYRTNTLAGGFPHPQKIFPLLAQSKHGRLLLHISTFRGKADMTVCGVARLLTKSGHQFTCQSHACRVAVRRIRTREVLHLFVTAITAHIISSYSFTLMGRPLSVEATMRFSYLTNCSGFTRITAYVGQLVDSAVDARIEIISQSCRPDPAGRCLNRPCELSELMSRTIAP